jgi:phosphatidylglycerophosphate synthase
MWPAHLLTLSRIPIAVGFWWAEGLVAVVLVGLAALTDTLDGNVARLLKRRGHKSPDIGGWLDPVVDKLFVVIVIAALARTVDPLILLLLATREILLVPLSILFLVRHGSISELHADALGKAATVAQLIALAIVVALPSWGLTAATTAAVLGFAAAVHYWRSVGRMHKYTRPSSQREISMTASSAR